MIRATKGLLQSARQVRRAATRQAKRKDTGGRRCVSDLVKETVNTERQAFGRRYADTVPKALSVGAVGMLDVGAIDALHVLLQDLAAEDDDGR